MASRMASQRSGMVRVAAAAKQRLQLGEGALDRVEVRRVGRQVEQDRTCGLDRLANTADLVPGGYP